MTPSQDLELHSSSFRRTMGCAEFSINVLKKKSENKKINSLMKFHGINFEFLLETEYPLKHFEMNPPLSLHLCVCVCVSAYKYHIINTK